MKDVVLYGRKQWRSQQKHGTLRMKVIETIVETTISVNPSFYPQVKEPESVSVRVTKPFSGGISSTIPHTRPGWVGNSDEP